MGQKINPYKVPLGHKGVWINKATFVVLKEDVDVAAFKKRLQDRKGPGWELGYVEQYHASANKPNIRIRRAN